MTGIDKGATLGERAIEELLRKRPAHDELAVCPELGTVAAMLDGSIEGDTLANAAAHLSTCPYCRDAWASLAQAEDRSVVRQAPLSGQRFKAAFSLAAAATILLAVAAAFSWWRSSSEPDRALQFKGPTDAISVAVERGLVRFRASAERRLEAGDRLGFFVTASSDGYLALFDVEQAGAVTALYPPREAGASGPIRAGRDLPLPDGAVVSSPTGCEWLVGVFSDEPLPLAEIEQELRRAKNAAKACALAPHLGKARSISIFEVKR